jgi:ADP-ribose pyrophosphatase YjhB (NUDIX family)
VLDGLGREVAEETGLVVERWAGQLYEVQVEAPDLGWHLRVEVHRAAEVSGELRIDDPDGIVIDAAYLPPAACDRCLVASPTWVREPLAAWIGGALPEASRFGYRVRGADPATFDVVRLA